MRVRFMAVAAVLIGIFATWSPSPAQAGHHLWRFTEMFSNASGTSQFIELFTAENNEPGVGPFTITTGDGKTFSFVTNLPAAIPTANTFILVATSNFAGLPGGVAPDYILPAGFLATGGGTLTYAGIAASIWNYGTLPTDGVHSLLLNGTTAVNSPTNFAGQSGSVNLAAAVPAVGAWGLVALVGALLLVGSGLLRRRRNSGGGMATAG